MANVGDLKVLLTADDKASDKIAKSGSSMKTTLGSLGKSYAVLGGIIAGTFAASVRDFMKTGDELHKMALRTGMSVEALDRLGYVANLSGNSLKDVENMLRRQTIAMNEARDGTMIGLEAFEKLGITLESIEGLNTEEQFLHILTTLADMTSETEQVDAAMAVFGNRMGTSVIPMIAGGTGALQDMITEATENARMTQEQADQAAILTDKMFALKTQLQGVSIQMASDLFPAMSSVITGLQNFLGFLKMTADMLSTNLPTALTATVVGVNALRTVLLMLTGQMGIMTGGISIILGLLITWGMHLATTEGAFTRLMNTVKKVINFFVERFTPQIEFVVNMFVDRINLMLKGANKVLNFLGKDSIPLLDRFEAKMLDLTYGIIDQTEALSDFEDGMQSANDHITKATTNMEEFTVQTLEGADATKKAKDTVDGLADGLKNITGGGFGGGGLGGGGLGGGGGGFHGVGGGAAMSAMMGAFPSLHSGQAQAEYNAALALMASRRVGHAGKTSITPIDIEAERKKHGAFSSGGFNNAAFNITNVNAITGSHVTKILSDAETRGLETLK